MNQVVAIYYDKYFNGSIIQQEFIDNASQPLTIDKDVTSYDVASFQSKLAKNDDIIEGTKVELYETGEGIDELIFSWVIYKIEPVFNRGFDFINIECRSDKYVFERRDFIQPKKSFECEDQFANRPTYPNGWLIEWWLYYINESDIYQFKGTTIPDTGSPFYNREFINTPQDSFVYIKSNDNVYENGVFLYKNPNGVFLQDFIESWFDDVSSFWDNRQLDSDINPWVMMNAEVGDNRFDVMEEITEQFETERDITKDGVVQIKDRIGKDRTSWPNYAEASFDWNNPMTSNIQSISVEWRDNRSNIVVALFQRDRSKVINNVDTVNNEPIYGITTKKFRDGNVEEKADKFAKKVNNIRRTYKVSIEQSALNVNIGDDIRILVQNTNRFFNTDTTWRVLRKKIKYEKASRLTEYEISEFKVKPFTQETFNREINKARRLQQL